MEPTTRGRSPIGNLLRIAAVLVIAYMAVYALESFHVTAREPYYALGGFRDSLEPTVEIQALAVTVPEVRCHAAVVDAWRAESMSSGWFGYAPLVSGTPVGGTGCRETSQHRLRLSLFGVFVAVGLWLVARRLDRPPGLGFDPAPT